MDVTDHHHRRHQHVLGTSVLVVPPTAPVMTLEECKTALGIADSAQDGMLPGIIAAAAGVMDPASGGWLGRALRPQTWEWRQSAFVGGEGGEPIKLPYPVLSAVTSVKYDDAAGVEQTLVEGVDYRVFGLEGHHKGYIAPAFGKSWPCARWDRESVRIRYIAGYAPAVAADPDADPPVAAVADQMPSPIKFAVVMAVRTLLSNVERNLYLSLDSVPGLGEKRYVVTDAANATIKRSTDSLLSTYREYP